MSLTLAEPWLPILLSEKGDPPVFLPGFSKV